MSRLVLCLGCHRSGTSLIARSLECLGAQLGPRAHFSGVDNPDFAEDQDILGIDQTLMFLGSTTWDTPTPIDWSTFGPMIPERFTKRVRGLIEERLSEHPIWVVKEPRMCRLLPFWRPLLNSIGCEVSVVFPVRHPLAVARSLQTRNDIPILDGLSLWLEYTERARNDVDPAWPSRVVEYEAMMTDPVGQIERIGTKLDLRMRHATSVAFGRYVVDDGLQHETGGDLFPLPCEIDILYRAMRAEAT